MFLFCFSFVSFNNYRIPRVNLVNRGSDVTPEGKYVTPYKVIPVCITAKYLYVLQGNLAFHPLEGEASQIAHNNIRNR